MSDFLQGLAQGGLSLSPRPPAAGSGMIAFVGVVAALAVGGILAINNSKPAIKSCVRVTADVSKTDIDAYIHSLDGRGEWSVLVEPDGEYTVISRPRSCETK